MGHWVSIFVSPGPPLPLGFSKMPSKICPALGKAWLGKKPQGFLQVAQTLQEQGNTCGFALGQRKDGRSPTPLCWTPFQGSAPSLLPRSLGWVWGQRLCCPAGLGWSHSYLRAKDQHSSTDSEPFDSSQDTGNWGLEPLKSQLPQKGFPGICAGASLCHRRPPKYPVEPHLGSDTSPHELVASPNWDVMRHWDRAHKAGWALG